MYIKNASPILSEKQEKCSKIGSQKVTKSLRRKKADSVNMLMKVNKILLKKKKKKKKALVLSQTP